MLKQIPCFTDVEPPSTRMSDFFPLTKWISVNLGSNPPIFISAQLSFGTPKSTISRIQPIQDNTTQETAEVVVVGVRNLMRQRALLFEQLEALRQAKGKKEMARAEANRLKEGGKTVEAKCKEVKQENDLLKKELEDLRASFASQKELEEEYQKQVYEMFFYGYQCCMKKNDITQDTPSFPSNDEDIAPIGSS
ncbi:hypothetical protein PVL29_017119 [Vitis rotundifolia]|uniref:Uncharacterized protein n=1 Tax=Vitis rotundifolia TaxID=103349 RepID=A0AA38Z9Z1_VITRO|nr:hypothetical protein PVL29_017119 [Vitis rotundifolia]